MSPYPTAIVRDLLGKTEYLASTMNRRELAQTIATFAGVTVDDVNATMAVPDQNRSGMLRLYGFLLRPDQIMHAPLRLAPACLASDAQNAKPPFHRLTWSIRALTSDPDTGHPFVTRCQQCRTGLAWSKTIAFDKCHFCGRNIWRDADVAGAMRPAAALKAALFAGDERRADIRRRLPKEVSVWSEADLLSLLEALSGLVDGPDSQTAEDDAAELLLTGMGGIVEKLDRRVETYKVRNSRLSNLAAIARLCCEIDKSRSRLTRGFLNSLVGDLR